MKITKLILLTLILSGCSTSLLFQGYEGQKKSDNEVAILFPDFGIGQTLPKNRNSKISGVYITSVNGKEMKVPSLGELHLLPGSHRIGVKVEMFGGAVDAKTTQTLSSKKETVLTFNAEAGKYYYVAILSGQVKLGSNLSLKIKKFPSGYGYEKKLDRLRKETGTFLR